MSVKFLKVPEGMYKRMYLLGGRALVSDVVLWYKLKALRSDGFFEAGFLGRANLDESQNTLYKRVSRLESYGLITIGKSGFSLSAYDKLFSFLEYDMTKKYRSGSFRRNGSFKIWKLSTDDVESIVDCMMYFDIKIAVARRLFVLNPKRQKLYERSSRKGQALLDAEEHLGKEVVKQATPLSGRTIASIFGYSTASAGNKALHRLVLRGFIKVERRYKIKDLNPQTSGSKYDMLRLMKRGGKYRMKQGVLMEILSNSVRPMLD